jgi:hypothetical protein
MLFFHLFYRMNSAAKICELRKFMLNGLQPFMPLVVSALSLWSISAPKPKLLIQLLNVSDLRSETPNLVPKNPYMIHIIRIAYLGSAPHDCTKTVSPWVVPAATASSPMSRRHRAAI